MRELQRRVFRGSCNTPTGSWLTMMQRALKQKYLLVHTREWLNRHHQQSRQSESGNCMQLVQQTALPSGGSTTWPNVSYLLHPCLGQRQQLLACWPPALHCCEPPARLLGPWLRTQALLHLLHRHATPLHPCPCALRGLLV